jgi:DNA (cytosine-5)-methyltransferase 1
VKIKAIDLFCGAGGLTFGLEKAGIHVVAGFDVDAGCKYAYETNNRARFYQQDLAKPDIPLMKKLLGGDRPTLIAGCAPCQSFSTYNRERAGDRRGWPLLASFLNIVKTIKPDFVTMENVSGLKADGSFTRFCNGLAKVGFKVTFSVVDCRNLGMAQQRRRLVLIASRHGIVPMPMPTHPTAEDFATVRDAIGEMPTLRAGAVDPKDPLHCASSVSTINIERLRASKPGGTWHDWPKRLRARCHTKEAGDGYVSVYGRMEWDKPSPTITGQCFGFGNGRFGHPKQNRALSLREAAILQSFPPTYQFSKKGEKIVFKRVGIMIGNAVPPILGEAIGRTIASEARKHQKRCVVRSRFKNTPPKRKQLGLSTRPSKTLNR